MKSNSYKAIILFFFLGASIWSCKDDNSEDVNNPPTTANCDTTGVTYNLTVKPILSGNCTSCHNPANANHGVNLESYSVVKTLADNGTLNGVITHASGYSSMPPNGKLSSCDITKIQKWIQKGAHND